MRTTLDLDDRVLAAARARVHAGLNKSVGEAVSALAIAGLTTQAADRDVTGDNGLLLLPDAPGHVINSEMVATALLDD